MATGNPGDPPGELFHPIDRGGRSARLPRCAVLAGEAGRKATGTHSPQPCGAATCHRVPSGTV